MGITGLRAAGVLPVMPPALLSSSRYFGQPSGTNSYFGFRLATAVVVPEPSTAVLAIMAGGLMWVLRKRFK